jgi:hypothetical protein
MFVWRGHSSTLTFLAVRWFLSATPLHDRAEDFLQHAHDLREAGSRLLHIGRAVEPVRRRA